MATDTGNEAPASLASHKHRQYAAPVVAAESDLDLLAGLLADAARIVAFTGAGISTESGIPDYRGPGGVWSTGKPPTLGDFLANETTRLEYWQRRRTGYRKMAATEPNAAHLALVDLERSGRLLGTITQNIDGLHQKAGADPNRVVELHGTSHVVRCLSCGTVWPALEIQERLERTPGEPRCEVCGGVLRAATVLFGEPMPVEPLRRAIALAQEADLMLVVGSSLVVQPAARLPAIAKQAGARLAMVNREPTPLDPLADLVVAGDAGRTLATATELALAWEPMRAYGTG
ncbi:MAG: NAD-dependent deacetylase [Chloroflexia bacterium]|nr:NAD-dependent deacetylase [Chloroflexia bacterium]